MKVAIASTIERILLSLHEPLSELDLSEMLSKTFNEGGLGRVYTQNPAYFENLDYNNPASYQRLRLLAEAVSTGDSILRTRSGIEESRIDFNKNTEKAAICYALLYSLGDERALNKLYTLLLDEKAPAQLIQAIKNRLEEKKTTLVAEMPAVQAEFLRKQYAKRIYLAPLKTDRVKQLGWLQERDLRKDMKRPITQEVVYWDQENWQRALSASLSGLSGPVKMILRGHANDHVQSLYGFSDKLEPAIPLSTMQTGILAALTANPAISFISISILSCCAGAMNDGFARGIAETLQRAGISFSVIAPLVPISVNSKGQIESNSVDKAVEIDAIKKTLKSIFDGLIELKKDHNQITQAYRALVKKIENSRENNTFLTSYYRDPRDHFSKLKADKEAFYEKFKMEYDEEKLLQLLAKLDQLHSHFLEPEKHLLNQPNSAVGFFSTPHGVVTRDPVAQKIKSPEAAEAELNEIDSALTHQPKTNCFC